MVFSYQILTGGDGKEILSKQILIERLIERFCMTNFGQGKRTAGGVLSLVVDKNCFANYLSVWWVSAKASSCLGTVGSSSWVFSVNCSSLLKLFMTHPSPVAALQQTQAVSRRFSLGQTWDKLRVQGDKLLGH